MSPTPAYYILRSDYDRPVTRLGRCAIVTGIILAGLVLLFAVLTALGPISAAEPLLSLSPVEVQTTR